MHIIYRGASDEKSIYRGALTQKSLRTPDLECVIGRVVWMGAGGWVWASNIMICPGCCQSLFIITIMFCFNLGRRTVGYLKI